MDPLWSETCWNTFKYFVILILYMCYLIVHMLDNKTPIRYTVNGLFFLDAEGISYDLPLVEKLGILFWSRKLIGTSDKKEIWSSDHISYLNVDTY